MRVAYALLLAALISPAYAQDQPAATPPRVPKVPTMFAPVSASLTDLLNDGWVVVSVGINMGGPMFTLNKGTKWILCGVDVGNGMFGGAGGATSECQALN